MRPRNRNHATAARARDARALAGMIAAAVLLGGLASGMLRISGPGSAAGPREAQASATPAGPSGPGEPAAKPDSAANAAKPTATTSKTTATPARPSSAAAARPAMARAASAKPAGRAAARKGATPAGSAVTQSPTHVDEQLTYQYNALGRRDPFQSLLSGEYVGADVGGDAPPDVGGIKVVGIVWGDADQFALVEDGRGDSHILRRGDKVMNGFVEALKRDAMIVNLTADGQSQSVTIPLTRKGDKTNATR